MLFFNSAGEGNYFFEDKQIQSQPAQKRESSYLKLYVVYMFFFKVALH